MLRVRVRAAVSTSLLVVAGVVAVVVEPWESPDSRSPAGPEGGAPIALVSAVEGEAEAMVAAKEAGAAVEVADLTTEYTQVFADPDGHFVAQMSPAPVRVRRGDGWVPIDLSLEVDETGRLVPAASPADVSISADGSGPLVELVEGERRLAMDWPGELPEPVVEGPLATFPAVLPGVDLVVESQVPGFATYLVVESAKAASNPALRKIDFGLDVTGVAVTAKEGRRFEARDPAGAVVFSTDPARMWDRGPDPKAAEAVDRIAERPGARAAEVVASVEQVNGSAVLRVAPDAALLADPATRWPVVIDPVWKTNTQQEAEWGMVWSNGMDFHNSSQAPRVGYDGWTSAPKKSRTFYEFGIIWLRSKQLNKATFRHHQIHSPGWTCNTTEGPAVRMFRAAEFGAGISWPGPTLYAKQGDDVSQAHGHQDVCGGSSVNEWDVTSGLRNAVADPADRYAVGMVSLNESDRMGWRKYKGTSTLLPEMIVEYNTPPAKPTDLEVWNSSASQKVNYFTALNRWFTQDHRPHMAGRITDPDGDLVQFQYQIWKNGKTDTLAWDFTTVHSFASGTFLKRRPPDGALTAEGDYWFRLRGIDNATGLAGPWSDRTDFTYDNTAPGPPTIVAPKHEISFDQGGYFRLEPGTGGAGRFHYGFTTSTPGTPTEWSISNAPRSVFRQAVRFGPDWMTVVAEDLAGNLSAPEFSDFRVRGAEATHVWHLDDTSAALGSMDLTLVGSPGWADGVNRSYDPLGEGSEVWNAADAALQLNGAGQYARTTGPVLADTSKSFSVSAWVRLAPAAAGKTNVVVSQQGPNSSAFFLEYLNDGWSFRVRPTDGQAFTVNAKAQADLGSSPQWVHLLGVYQRPRDVAQGVVKLYVDGELAAEADAGPGVFQATGDLYIGASRWNGVAGNFLNGTVDEVRVFPGSIDPLGARVLASEMRDR